MELEQTLENTATDELKRRVRELTDYTRNGLPEYLKAPLRYQRKLTGHALDYQRAQMKHETGN